MLGSDSARSAAEAAAMGYSPPTPKPYLMVVAVVRVAGHRLGYLGLRG